MGVTDFFLFSVKIDPISEKCKIYGREIYPTKSNAWTNLTLNTQRKWGRGELPSTWALVPDLVSSNSGSHTYSLYKLVQVTSFLCGSSVKRDSSSPYSKGLLSGLYIKETENNALNILNA